MRAWLLDRPGPPESLRLGTLPSPARARGPARHEVELLVAVDAVGLNPVDHKTARTGHPEWTWPQVLGLDVAGRVVGVRAPERLLEEQSWRIPELGTRVLFHQDLREQGGYATHTRVDADICAVIPPHLDPIAAASLPCAGLTALDAVERRLRQVVGQTVLVHGGSGGVGAYAIQLAKLFGARVIATARPENEALVRDLGALHVLDYRSPDLATQVRAIAPDGVDAVIDTVSSRSATAALDLLRHAGHLVAVNGRPDLSAVPEFGLAPTVSEIALGAAYTHGGRAGRQWIVAGLYRLMQLIGEGLLVPPPIEVVGFDAIPEALGRLAAGQAHGRLVANLRWG